MTATYRPEPPWAEHSAWCPCPACEHRPGLSLRPLVGDLELHPGPAVAGGVPSSVPGWAAGRAGGSALAEYRRRRRAELRAWTRQLPLRVGLVAGLGTASALTANWLAGPDAAWLVGAGATTVAGWRLLRWQPSPRARAWREGARGERATARRLKRLERKGWQVFHDLKVPGYQANIDHLVIGPTGVWVIDSKRYRLPVHVGPDGGLWRGPFPMAHTLAMAAWYAQVVTAHLGVPARAVVCVHGRGVPHGGVIQDGVTVLPARRLRRYLTAGEPVLDPATIHHLATTATPRFPPAT